MWMWDVDVGFGCRMWDVDVDVNMGCGMRDVGCGMWFVGCGCAQVLMFYGSSDADMIFVKIFTQPDFQAKNFTPVKCGLVTSSLTTNERKLINISNLGIIWLDMNLFREKKYK